MKITLVGPVYPYRGGISHFNTMMRDAFLKNGHNMQMVSFRRQYPNWLYPGQSDKDPSEKPFLVEAKFTLDPFYPWTWYKAARQIKKYNPDLVVFHWWTTFWSIPYTWLSWSLRKSDLKVIFLIHNVFPHETKPYDPYLVRFALSQGQAFVTLVKSESERLSNLIPDSKIIVFSHPHYKVFAESRMDKAKARAKLKIPVKDFLILSFGIVRRYKGLRFALEALEQLKIKGYNPKYIIAGEIWDNPSSYHNYIDKYQLNEIVRIDNRYIHNEEVPSYYSAADLFVAPYVGGTQSGAVTIALEFGLPVITTPNIAAGVGKTYKNQITVVPEGDVDSLASAIISSMDRPGIINKTVDQPSVNWENLVNTVVRTADELEGQNK